MGIKILNFDQVINHQNKDIFGGFKGWIKGKCLDKKCNTITIWNSQRTGIKCAQGSCAKCGGDIKRTTFSTTADYIIIGA